MMSMYSNGTLSGAPHSPLKSNQACLSCKKQKRKCDKNLPSCSLCSRMQRACDYSIAPPTPSRDDLAEMQRQIADLTSKIDAQSPVAGVVVASGAKSTASPATSSSYAAPSHSSFSDPPSETSISVVQNRFPAIAFLDSDAFKHGGCVFKRDLKPNINSIAEL
jgi:hypothetical protein